MNYGNLSERLSEAAVRAAGHPDAKQSQANRESDVVSLNRFSVTISREAGTRGPAVARILGELLGWQVYDRELLELVARDLDVRANVLEAIDERHVPWLLECLEALASGPAVTEARYVPHLIDVLMSLSAHGRSVIVGRGGAFVLPPSTTLRVRMIAPLEDRIGVVCREQGLSRDAAARFVTETDRARATFVKNHFHRDPADPQYFDVMLNQAALSIDQCAHLIAEALCMKSGVTRLPQAASRPVKTLAGSM